MALYPVRIEFWSVIEADTLEEAKTYLKEEQNLVLRDSMPNVVEFGPELKSLQHLPPTWEPMGIPYGKGSDFLCHLLPPHLEE